QAVTTPPAEQLLAAVCEQQRTEHRADDEQAFAHGKELLRRQIGLCDAPVMPTSAPLYVERLSIRARWWAVVIVIALFGSSELFAGFNGWIVAIVLAAVLVPTVGLLAMAGRTTLRVDADGVHAGGQTLGFDDIDTVQALDAGQTRQMLGPQADPAARLVVRGYIREAVVIHPLDTGPVPYWLVSTRHPQRVIAAVEQAARVTRAR